MTLLKTPTILIFDVNETLLDLTSLEPFFARVFGEARVMREWFAQLERVAFNRFHILLL